MKFLRILTSRVFLKHLMIAAGIVIFIIVASLVWLRIYTQHSRYITVPDFTGLNENDVEIIARTKNLRIEIADSSFSDYVPKGTVIRQNPGPGSRVKDMRRVYLTMNAINPEMVIMPKLTGVSMRQARAILETYGLSVGNISYKPNIAVNNVLEQRMKDTVATPGELVPKGTMVDLVLGMGLSVERTPVPDLVGKNISMAKSLLIDLYLNIGAIIFDNTVENEADSVGAFIWRQRPAFDLDTRLNLGSNIDVWLTVDSTKLPVIEEIHLNEQPVYEETDW